VYLLDTDVISEVRKGRRANGGVRIFFDSAKTHDVALFISAVTIGELRRAVERVRSRRHLLQARRLEQWLQRIRSDYSDAILPFDEDIAQVWGRLRVGHGDNPLDKQVAATALIHDLTVVTRNWSHYDQIGVRVLNPFT